MSKKIEINNHLEKETNYKSKLDYYRTIIYLFVIQNQNPY